MPVHETKHIFFVGIGGIGMSALALVLKDMGHHVSGSDAKQSNITDMLIQQGIDVVIGHDLTKMKVIDLLIYSSAVPKSNSERRFAKENHIPEMRRAELLGDILIAHKSRLAIAGTHGKTTTTAMVGHIFESNQMRPTILVGGILQDSETNGLFEKGDVCIVEADEYDRSFLALNPTSSIVTTLDEDHLDIYKDLDDIKDTFIAFLEKTPFWGLNILCSDAPNIQDIYPYLTKPFVRYGFNPDTDYQLINYHIKDRQSIFNVIHKENRYDLSIQLPGKHNVLNAVAAFIISIHQGIPVDNVISALASFKGVQRRFEFKGEAHNIKFYDDYAHHPKEVTATLKATRRAFPSRRIVVIFQPHLFSRTQDFAKEFAIALSLADVVLLSEIYPAREKPILGVSSQLIYSEISSKKVLLGDINNAENIIYNTLKANDIVMTMGAGDIWTLGPKLLKGLELR